MPERYENPPGFPTKDDLKKLPRWARLAFAARCALRVRPLIEQPLLVKIINKLIDINTPLDAADIASKPSNYLDSVTHSRALAIIRNVNDYPSIQGLDALTNSVWRSYAKSLAHTLATVSYSVRPAPVRAAEAAAAAAYYASRTAAYKLSTDISTEIIHDFHLLKHLSIYNQWTNETRVSQDLFGPLWPDGEPDEWPPDDQYDRSQQSLTIRVALPPIPDSEEARSALRKRIGDVLQAANAVHLAHGGSGLRISKASVEAKTRTGVTPGVES